MSLLSNIKKILPGSSRSLHAMHEDMDRRFDEVFSRIEQADNGINMNINYKFDTRLFPEIELLKQRQQSLSEQMSLRFELLARRAYPDLTPFELRCKIFDALPDAEGDIRLMQQANAALMSKLDAICTANNTWMVHPESGLSVQCGDVDLEAQRTVVSSAEIDLVQSVFDSFNEKAHDLGLLTDEFHGDFAYAIDNVFDAPKRKIIWDCNDILPVRKHPFDSFSFLVPAKAEKVADDCCPGWPYMPMDICGHDHFAKDVLSDPDVRSAMARFVDECN